MLKYKQLLVFLFVCTVMSPLQIRDRFIAGQLAKHKQSNYYVDQFPVYRSLFADYQRECHWGYYVSMDKHTKTPVFGLVFMF